MQDEISEKTINLAVSIGKMDAAAIKEAIEKLSAKLKEMKQTKPQQQKSPPEVKHGKKTLKQLSHQSDGLSSIELKDPNLRRLNGIMKKHGIDFAAVKDGKGKYTLFFKGKDADAMTHAFKAYTAKTVKKADKQAIKTELQEAKAAAQKLNAKRDKVKKREKGAIDK